MSFKSCILPIVWRGGGGGVLVPISDFIEDPE